MTLGYRQAWALRSTRALLAALLLGLCGILAFAYFDTYLIVGPAAVLMMASLVWWCVDVARHTRT